MVIVSLHSIRIVTKTEAIVFCRRRHYSNVCGDANYIYIITGIVHAVSHALSAYGCCSDRSRRQFHCFYLPLALRTFLPPFSQLSLSLGQRHCNIDFPFRAELAAIFYPLHVDQLFISVLTGICCKKLPWWKLRSV